MTVFDNQDVEKREAEAERKIEGLTNSFNSTRSSLATAEAGLAQMQGEKDKLQLDLQAKHGREFSHPISNKQCHSHQGKNLTCK